jgi:hypothetical protein
MRWAKADKGEITVSGMLKDDGIAIRYMMYKGDTVTPYYKPADHYIFPSRPWIRCCRHSVTTSPGMQLISCA